MDGPLHAAIIIYFSILFYYEQKKISALDIKYVCCLDNQSVHGSYVSHLTKRIQTVEKKDVKILYSNNNNKIFISSYNILVS